jgi:carboxy-terminal domain RNA polymerase II polypeptide A small phosphatase
MERLLVILDLDETLVFASEVALARPPDFTTRRYAVYRRPYLAAFLEAAFSRFRVGIWTSSGEDYAAEVARTILPADARLEFLWCAERCTVRFDHATRRRYPVKRMRKLKRKGYDLARAVAVDDTAEKYEANYGNLVVVRPFEGDVTDDELPALLEYLTRLSALGDVRRIEKRGWRAMLSFPS